MKVLVTGGNGFIGRYTCENLLDRGHEPLVLDVHGEPPVPGAELWLGDLRDDVAVTEAMAHADAYIHLAGVLGTQETIFNPRPAALTNVIGGLNLLEAAAQYKVPGVNIAVGNFWMNNTYSITKNTVERFVKMFQEERGLSCTTVRALNAYGPRQTVAAPYGTSKVRKIMPAFICRALSGTPIEIYGDGKQIMDMIYVADVADVLVSAMEWTAEHGSAPEVLEVGSGVITSVLDIAHTVISSVGDGSVIHIPMRPGEPENSVVLGHPRTLELIGYDWSQFKPLDEGVDLSVSYFADYLVAHSA